MTSLPTHTHTRVHIRKIADRWHIDCPCGFTWRTRWHRLALRLAMGHKHRES